MQVNLQAFVQNKTELGYVGVRGGNRGASSEMNLHFTHSQCASYLDISEILLNLEFSVG